MTGAAGGAKKCGPPAAISIQIHKTSKFRKTFIQKQKIAMHGGIRGLFSE